MKAHLTKVSLALLSTIFLLGCQERGSGAVGPDGAGIQAKPGMGGGMGGGGDTFWEANLTAHGPAATDPMLITLTPATVSKKNGFLPSDNFFTLVSIQPTRSSLTLTRGQVSASLKRGKIIRVQFWLDEGHGSSRVVSATFPIDPPVTPSSAGFTFHLHADGVELRESNGSPPIGTISIGDLVYTAQ